jgi:DnaA family protein
VTGGRQLTLALRWSGEFDFDGYYVAGARDWLDALRAWAEAPLGALALVGPRGCGKSHLLAAVAGVAVAERPVLGFSAARLAEVETLWQGLGAGALILIDDLEAAVGDERAEQALFRLVNAAHDRRWASLLTARRRPAQLSWRLPDVASRLAPAVVCMLPVLDDDGRAEVLRRKASSLGLELDPALIAWLFREVGRDLGRLGEVLAQLERDSLAERRKPTAAWVRRRLANVFVTTT